MNEPANDDELREYTAAHFTTPEAAEKCIQWVRAQESAGRRFPTAADAAGVYVFTGLSRVLR